MSLLKPFLISLIAFLAINFIFELMALIIAQGGDAFEYIGAEPIRILLMLFGPIGATPTNTVTKMHFAIVNFDTYLEAKYAIAFIIRYIGWIVSPVIAVILAGRFGDSKIITFGSWFLVAMIAMIFVLISFITTDTEVISYLELTTTTLNEAYIVMFGVINGIFYGGIAVLTSKSDTY